MKKFHILLFLSFFSIINFGYSQAYYSVGYSVGKFTTGLPNMRNTIYHFNNFDYPNFDNKFIFTNLPHGVSFEIGLAGQKYYYFARWTNMHLISKGSGVNPTNTSENLNLKIKVRLNQLSPFNFGIFVTKKIGFAFSPLDFADFKVLYKSNVNINNKINYNSNKWDDFYNVNKGSLSSYFTAGSTFYLDFFVSKKLHLRFSYYNDWFGESLGGYRYRANSFTVNLSYRFNKK